MPIANTTIQLKKSNVAGNVPVSLSSGELALNFFDGKLYYKNAQNTINYFAAGITKSFATVNSNSSLVLASSNNDILSFAAGNNISISTDTVGKTITIGTDAKMLYTASNTAPITPRLGDKWYYIARDLVYEWSTDGASSFWLDNQSPTTTSNPGSGGGTTTDLTPVYAKANAAFNKANSANLLAQAAFTTANTASDSITIIQGVDVTQNNIISIIQGVDVTQNTNITAINNLVVSSFDKANSANILAQAAFTAANAAGSSAFSQAAFNQANTAYTLANTIPIIRLNSISITSNVVIGTNYNGFSVGPLLINNGASVTISNGQRWVII
jgi:hypothetical protein